MPRCLALEGGAGCKSGRKAPPAMEPIRSSKKSSAGGTGNGALGREERVGSLGGGTFSGMTRQQPAGGPTCYPNAGAKPADKMTYADWVAETNGPIYKPGP